MGQNESKSVARRRLLKTLAGLGGVGVAAAALPSKWTRPVIDKVIVPAHAQASPGFTVLCSSTPACGSPLTIAANGSPVSFSVSVTVSPAPPDGSSIDFQVQRNASTIITATSSLTSGGATRGVTVNTVNDGDQIVSTWTYSGVSCQCSHTVQLVTSQP